MIIFTKEDGEKQVAELLEAYDGLFLTESGADKICIGGEVCVFRADLGFVLNRTYEVKILVPLNSDELPKVMDSGGAIDKDYPHRYETGELCLEANAVIMFRFIDGFRLVEWMKEFVEPFFFSYEYYVRFGFLPFGERPHGVEGIIDAYRDILCELHSGSVWGLLKYCGERKYRGCDACPCGSGNKVSDCHGGILFPLMTDRGKKDIIKKDVKYVKKEMKKYELTRENYKTTE